MTTGKKIGRLVVASLLVGALLLLLDSPQIGSESNAGSAEGSAPATSPATSGPAELRKDRKESLSREQERLRKELETELRKLETARIDRASQGVKLLPVSNELRSLLQLPEDQEYRRIHLKSLVLTAPDPDEAEAVRERVRQTFATKPFQDDPGAAEEAQRLLERYLNYPKKFKVLCYTRDESSVRRESFAVTVYNTDEVKELPEEQGTNFAPMDFESDREDIDSFAVARERYGYLFGFRE